MSGFLGSYVHQVDDKGRLSLPASFRRGVQEESLVVVKAHDGALTLYPESTWVEVEGRLLELLRLQPNSRPYVLRITADAVEVSPDKQGRILIPQRLLEQVGVEDTVLLVGVIDRIEVWNPDRFEGAVSDRKDEFEGYTHQVFA